MAGNMVHNAFAAAQKRDDEAAEARRAYLRAQDGGMSEWAAEYERKRATSPYVIHCHVSEDDGVTAEGHVAQFSGIGEDQTKEAAKTAGWVESRGYGWTCPACATDMTEVGVFKVRLHGMNGPVVHRTAESAVEEVRELLECWAEEWRYGLSNGEPLDRITITNSKLTRGALNTIREFDGY